MEETTQHIVQGIAASPGIGYGAVYIHDSRRPPIRRYALGDDQIEAELARFEQAVERTRLQLQETSRMVAVRIDKAHSAIFDAQQVLLEDPLLVDACRDEIRSRKFNAEAMLDDVVERVRAVFQEISSPHFSLKTNDLVDVASRIRENLCPESARGLLDLTRDVVLAAHDLRPSDTARLDTRRVLAIVTEAGGPTSHSAILAKALKIPAVVGAEGVLKRLNQDDSVIVDGYTGRVTLTPSGADIERLRKRQNHLKRQSESLKMLRDLPCETRDGYAVDLAMNMEFPSEVGGVRETGAQGIGLFRSEFFYIGRGYIPRKRNSIRCIARWPSRWRPSR
jgi:phosphotransferase system enzyme I (PtsI)